MANSRTLTAVDVLRGDEERRTRALLVGELVTVGAAGLLALVSPGPAHIRPWLVAVSALAATLLAVGLRGRRFSTRRLLLMHLGVIPFVVLSYVFFGVWSFFTAGSAVGTFVFAMGSSRPFAWLSYLLMAMAPAVGMLGLATGLITPTGLVRPLPMPPWVQVGFAAYLQLYFASMFWLGRASRRSQFAAVTELESALRKVDERDALLDEAARDLDRLEAGGRGRWTGSRVGPWRLGTLIGRGGMGEVYESVHADTGRTAAIKLVALELEESTLVAARFQREAQILERLTHPAIVELYEVGEDRGIPYLAMEKLAGESLAMLLRRARSLPLADVTNMVAQVASGLEHALAAEVVHRDLKPQNLFRVADSGQWKILDFGVSKLGAGATLTRDKAIGTPGYMAPEQIHGGSVDHRVDVFALAAVAYRSLTGVPAFSGDQVRVLYDVMHRQPRRPGSELPSDVELVLALGLAKSRDERLASARQLADALGAAAENRLPEAMRARARALLARHPWGGFDSRDERTEQLAGGRA
jgi:eukaryotic-like serine/threonine-protein kinase